MVLYGLEHNNPIFFFVSFKYLDAAGEMPEDVEAEKIHEYLCLQIVV